MSDSAKDAFYAAPGANEAFLRPPAGHGYAPRRIAVAAAGADALHLAWIHRRGEREFVATGRQTPGHRGRLRPLATLTAPLTAPAFIGRPGTTRLLVAGCAAGGRQQLVVHELAGCDWRAVAVLPTACAAIWRVTGVATPTGLLLLYAGVVPDRTSTSIFVRRGSGPDAWGAEELLAADASLNRPVAAVAADGTPVIVADAYDGAAFGLRWRRLDDPAWQVLPTPPGEALFPSLVSAADGAPAVAWLHQQPVRRDDVMGLRQEARAARFDGTAWSPLGDVAADLNMGLLPVRRYFGYDGLRRYPRLLTTTTGELWMLWEQQKDEAEIWDNLANGELRASRWDGTAWEPPRGLLDRGCLFAFDSRTPADPAGFAVAAKGRHHRDGNDFVVVRASLADAPSAPVHAPRLWAGWRPHAPVCPRSPAGPYWGDLHCHSVLSPDAEGEPDELYFHARDLGGLDFVCLADNDFYPSRELLDSQVDYVAHLARGLTEPGRFVAFSGYEWTFHRPDAKRSFNHRIVVFPEAEHRIARRTEAGGRTQKAFRAYLEETGYFNFPHHAYWRLLHAPGEWGVEITAAWGPYILDAATALDALNAGDRFAFLGNSDSHRFLPGLGGALTAVYADRLDRAGLLAAIRARRTVATTGNRTGIRFWVNDAFIGGEARGNGPPELRWEITPEQQLVELDIVRDGRVVHRATAPHGHWTDIAGGGTHWYLLHVREADEYPRYEHNVAPAWGCHAWTSPIWTNMH